ncbi:putative protein with domain of unknown function (DUF3425) [Lyophyllum shimeji]|uniref:BZIP domain-containing protein n=1 Tax=Lyophyllum shimeji TaxID=47721 RepID=A0A9P3PDU0_LYOSH|nr:putative protein with domain of unknown function (DUF3425) [Lyophyllum shimeji]
MRADKEPRERSVSENLDSELESHNGEGTNHPGKPGRKKNPNSQAARRDQNRIAQREFRLRKQQRIRDLEARVEILSGGQDEALGEMRNMLRDLMAENQTLRGLLRSLAGFIGEGAGGLLPKLGWDMADFTQFINRSETDTAWEGYQARKKAAEAAGLKRPAEEDASGSRAKKARSGETETERHQNGFNLLMPMGAAPLSANCVIPGGSRPHEGNGGILSDLMRGSGESSMYMQQGSPASGTYAGAPVGNYQPSYMSGVNLNMESPLAPIHFNPPNTANVAAPQPLSNQQQARQGSLEPLDDDDEPNKVEAYKLIHYHLDNYKRNNQYCLPASLRPTIVQRTIPHESVIDGILHAELRDRMILLRNRYDLVECLIDFKRSVTIHGDDVLAHTNWEIGEKFLRQYGFLIDKATLAIANRWRRERGEPELRLTDIGSSESTPPA